MSFNKVQRHSINHIVSQYKTLRIENPNILYKYKKYYFEKCGHIWNVYIRENKSYIIIIKNVSKSYTKEFKISEIYEQDMISELLKNLKNLKNVYHFSIDYKKLIDNYKFVYKE